jgi:predicted DNA-binding transcriptional regulator YafY
MDRIVAGSVRAMRCRVVWSGQGNTPPRLEIPPVQVSTLRRSQLDRLLRIIHVLRSGRRPNVRQLAEECEVSRRTIFRDLDSIEVAGIPVEYDPARQGYRIQGDEASGHRKLTEREVLALAVLTAQNGTADPFGLKRVAREAIGKLLESLDAGARERVEAVLDAVSERAPADVAPPLSQAFENLFEAIARRVQVRLTLHRSSTGATKVAPYRIFADGSGWHLVGRSSIDRGVRLFALAEIEDVILTDEQARIPPRFRLAAWLELSKRGRATGPIEAETDDPPPPPADFSRLGG